MSSATRPAFGRRRNQTDPREPPRSQPAAVPEPAILPLSARMAELGALCLGQLDPAVVANMPAERLTPEVER